MLQLMQLQALTLALQHLALQSVEMQSGRLWMCLVVAAAVRIQMGARIASDQATPPVLRVRPRLQSPQMKGAEEGVLLGLLTQRFLEVGVVVVEVVGREATAGRAIEFESL